MSEISTQNQALKEVKTTQQTQEHTSTATLLSSSLDFPPVKGKEVLPAQTSAHEPQSQKESKEPSQEKKTFITNVSHVIADAFVSIGSALVSQDANRRDEGFLPMMARTMSSFLKSPENAISQAFGMLEKAGELINALFVSVSKEIEREAERRREAEEKLKSQVLGSQSYLVRDGVHIASNHALREYLSEQERIRQTTSFYSTNYGKVEIAPGQYVDRPVLNSLPKGELLFSRHGKDAELASTKEELSSVLLSKALPKAIGELKQALSMVDPKEAETILSDQFVSGALRKAIVESLKKSFYGESKETPEDFFSSSDRFKSLKKPKPAE